MKIKIYNEKWEILKVTQKKLQEVMEDKKQTWGGACDNWVHKIYIDKDSPKCKIKFILVHEVGHAILNSKNNGMKFNEENVCDFVANHLEEINRITNKYMKKEI